MYCTWSPALISDSLSIFHLQAGEPSVQQLEGQYQSVISALRNKLDSKPAPPILHLDTAYLQEETRNVPAFPTTFPGTPVNRPSFSQDSKGSGSLLAALMSEIEKFSMQDGDLTGDESQTSETSSDRDGSPEVTPVMSEDRTDLDNGAQTELTSTPFPLQSTTVVQSVVEGDHIAVTSDPRPIGLPVQPFNHHRKRRSLLRKRQLPWANGKGTHCTINIH